MGTARLIPFQQSINNLGALVLNSEIVSALEGTKYETTVRETVNRIFLFTNQAGAIVGTPRSPENMAIRNIFDDELIPAQEALVTARNALEPEQRKGHVVFQQERENLRAALHKLGKAVCKHVGDNLLDASRTIKQQADFLVIYFAPRHG